MGKLAVTEEKIKSAVKGTTGQTTTLEVQTASLEILVGGPYKDSSYGHAALRVITKGSDKTYDYGRYGDVWGDFKSEGEGILNVWTNFNAYIANENRHGRVTTGFRYDVPEEKAQVVTQYFETKIAGKTPSQETGTKKRYRIGDYFALAPNCVTLTLDGAKTAFPDIDHNAAKFNQGRGLGMMEKAAAKYKGWPKEIFMPADLQAMLEDSGSRKPSKVTIYKT